MVVDKVIEIVCHANRNLQDICLPYFAHDIHGLKSHCKTNRRTTDFPPDSQSDPNILNMPNKSFGQHKNYAIIYKNAFFHSLERFNPTDDSYFKSRMI